VDLDRNVIAALNGDPIVPDPRYPLAAGDAVTFIPAEAGSRTSR
jgi:molybdopterin converting factor small subunit